MASYADRYRRTYAILGHELTPRDGRAESRIAAAEARLGIRVPKSLRDYYLVAGRERRFNQVHNRLLAPDGWRVERGRLVFMEENQAVVSWGVEAIPRPAGDPPVFQGVEDETIRWYREHDKCSVFLLGMLHWQGAFGGAMRHTGTAPVPRGVVNELDRDWRFVGEVNKMRAYHRPGQAVCFLKWDDPFMREGQSSPWRVFAGASTGRGLRGIAEALDVTFERWGA
jgi:hypothetical protein